MPKLELQQKINNNLTTNSNSSNPNINIGSIGSEEHTHDNYVSVSSGDTITAQHQYNFNGAPFLLGANSQGNKVIGLNADLLDGFSFDYFATASDMVLVQADITNIQSDITTLTSEVDQLQNESYLVVTSSASLNNERVMTIGVGMSAIDAGAGLSYTLGIDLASIAGVGILSDASTLYLPEPDTLSTTSINEITDLGHTHVLDFTTTGEVSKIIATDSQGKTQLVGLGIGAAPNATIPLLIHATSTPQIKITRSPSYEVSMSLDVSGNILLETNTGNIIFSPNSDYILPSITYSYHLGSASKMYLSASIAELRVITLVPTDVISSIGGAIYTAETTELVEDINGTQTTIKIKHNNVSINDVLRMQKGGQFEALKVTSNPVLIPATGYFSIGVERGINSTGGDNWTAGDAVQNTGNVGDGFIYQYALNSINGTNDGPAIDFHVRTSQGVWYGIRTAASVGNLKNNYGITSDSFGIGAGDINGVYFTIEDKKGFRIIEDDKAKFRVFGSEASNPLNDGTVGQLRIGYDTDNVAGVALAVFPDLDNDYFGKTFGAGDVLFGNASLEHFYIDASTSDFKFRRNNTILFTISGITGQLFLGDPLTDNNFGSYDQNRMEYRDPNNGTFKIEPQGPTNGYRITFNGGTTSSSDTLYIDSIHNSNGLQKTIITTNTNTVFYLEDNHNAGTSLGYLKNNNSIIYGVDTGLVSKHILTGTYNYGVIIGRNVNSGANPSELLQIIGSNIGEGAELYTAFAGRSNLGEGWANFTHRDRKLQSVGRGLMISNTGQTFLDAPLGTDVSLRINNSARVVVTNPTVRILTDNTAGSGIHLQTVGFLGVGNYGSNYIQLSHYNYRTSAGQYAFMQDGSSNTFVNAGFSNTIFLRINNITKLSLTNTATTISTNLFVSGVFSITGNSTLNGQLTVIGASTFGDDAIVEGELQIERVGVPYNVGALVFISPQTVHDSIKETGFSGDNFVDNTISNASMTNVPQGARAVLARVHVVMEVANDGWNPLTDLGRAVLGGTSQPATDIVAQVQQEGTHSNNNGQMVANGVARLSPFGDLFLRSYVNHDVNKTHPDPDIEYRMKVQVVIYGYFIN